MHRTLDTRTHTRTTVLHTTAPQPTHCPSARHARALSAHRGAPRVRPGPRVVLLSHARREPNGRRPRSRRLLLRVVVVGCVVFVLRGGVDGGAVAMLAQKRESSSTAVPVFTRSFHPAEPFMSRPKVRQIRCMASLTVFASSLSTGISSELGEPQTPGTLMSS